MSDYDSGRVEVEGTVPVTGTFTPALSTIGVSSTVTASNVTATLLLPFSISRLGFVLAVDVGIVYIGLGFAPTPTQYSYRMTNHSIVEKDYFVGNVYALADTSPKDVYITELK